MSQKKQPAVLSSLQLSRRGVLAAGARGSLLLLLGPAQLAWGAQVVAVRVWPAKDYTRVTLESDVALKAQHFLMPGPDRLVIDITGLELSAQLKDLVRKVRPDDPYIAHVRVGQNKPDVVRLVLDLKQGVKPQVFGLAPVAAYQHRMVFDLYPTKETDPAAALQVATGASAPSGAGAASSPGATAPGASSPLAPGGEAAAADGSSTASRQAAEAMNDALGDFITDLRRKPGEAPSDRAVAKAAQPKSAAAPAEDDDDKTPNNGAQRLVNVALDPGHGGEDPGAIGPSGLYEKHVALAIAMKLRARINAQPGMRAMLTREADYFVPLHERVRKARRVQADLLVSIHADAFLNPQAQGPAAVKNAVLADVFGLAPRLGDARRPQAMRSSTRSEKSTARTSLVSLPMEMRSTPVAAMPRSWSSWTLPEASSRAWPCVSSWLMATAWRIRSVVKLSSRMLTAPAPRASRN